MGAIQLASYFVAFQQKWLLNGLTEDLRSSMIESEHIDYYSVTLLSSVVNSTLFINFTNQRITIQKRFKNPVRWLVENTTHDRIQAFTAQTRFRDDLYAVHRNRKLKRIELLSSLEPL